MKRFVLILSFILHSLTIYAGDDSSGPIKFSTDLGTNFQTFQMGNIEKKWSASLVKNMNYKGEVVHFVKTSIILYQDGSEINGAVYQALEKPDYFYIVNADSILNIGKEHPYSPGVGGFSMHRPKSKNFIVCLNFQSGGVPAFNSTAVVRGPVSWQGNVWNRFK